MPKSARLWIPAEEGVPRPLLCESCKARFRIEQRAEFTKHVIDCSQQNEEAERAASPRYRYGEDTVFAPENGYVVEDLEKWVALNRQALIEGRKKM